MSAHLQKHLLNAWTTVVTLCTSSQREGWKLLLLHVFICFLISLSLNSLLMLVLNALQFKLLVSLLVSGVCTAITAGALIFSKTGRCFCLLLLITCGMREGRNILLATGASLVCCWSGASTFSNVQNLSQSIVCNLVRKMEFLKKSPISNYQSILEWYRDVFKTSNFFIGFSVDIVARPSVQSQELKEKLENASRDIRNKTDEIEEMLQKVLRLIQIFVPILGIVLIFISLIMFFRKFMGNKKYNNKFITKKFVLFDDRQKQEGKPSLLPLSEQEAQRYITIPCVCPKRAEIFPMLLFSIPVGIQISSWIYVMGLDALVYWVIVVFKKILHELEPHVVPLKLELDGKQRDYSFLMSLFEEDCIKEPTLFITSSLLPLTIIIFSLLLLCLLSAKLMELKFLVSEQFYPEVADKRVKHLHAKILRQRAKQNAKDLEKARLQIVAKDMRFWFPIVDFFK